MSKLYLQYPDGVYCNDLTCDELTVGTLNLTDLTAVNATITNLNVTNLNLLNSRQATITFVSSSPFGNLGANLICNMVYEDGVVSVNGAFSGGLNAVSSGTAEFVFDLSDQPTQFLPVNFTTVYQCVGSGSLITNTGLTESSLPVSVFSVVGGTNFKILVANNGITLPLTPCFINVSFSYRTLP